MLLRNLGQTGMGRPWGLRHWNSGCPVDGTGQQHVGRGGKYFIMIACRRPLASISGASQCSVSDNQIIKRTTRSIKLGMSTVLSSPGGVSAENIFTLLQAAEGQQQDNFWRSSPLQCLCVVLGCMLRTTG